MRSQVETGSCNDDRPEEKASIDPLAFENDRYAETPHPIARRHGLTITPPFRDVNFR